MSDKVIRRTTPATPGLLNTTNLLSDTQSQHSVHDTLYTANHNKPDDVP